MVIFRHISVFFLFALLSITFSCSKNKFGNDSVRWEDYELYDIYEDQYGNKGMVAVKEEGENYKCIIVVSADEAELSWGPVGELVFKQYSNVDDNELYVDLSYDPWSPFFFTLTVNQIVEDNDPTKFPAFQWCFDKNGNEKQIHSSSWMLAGLAEINMIFQILKEGGLLNEKLSDAGFEQFAVNGTPYWVCCEDFSSGVYFTDEDLQINLDFDPYTRAIPIEYPSKGKSNKSEWAKDRIYRVRAIKYIYYEVIQS